MRKAFRINVCRIFSIPFTTPRWVKTMPTIRWECEFRLCLIIIIPLFWRINIFLHRKWIDVNGKRFAKMRRMCPKQKQQRQKKVRKRECFEHYFIYDQLFFQWLCFSFHSFTWIWICRYDTHTHTAHIRTYQSVGTTWLSTKR